ncbi:malonate transporter subunit MadM [Pelosinus fermentans]|uniref:Malonate transporter, MadM subunit n=1 Tax=Pelosinus fermentans JBW45 TaxID=1192197 RepID=I9NQU6_9FIRM|nr:malonate transporter subunit MadM [Pelosinus fermentans]AJQ26750.1 malonate transporter, MadM subunit [Pelosinus fermentans JBW45]
MDFGKIILDIFVKNGLVMSFLFIGLVTYLAYLISDKLTNKRIHGSAIAIVFGLMLAYWGGIQTAGHKGLADIKLFTGVGLMGGGMLRDFAIVSTAFGARLEEIKKCGTAGAMSLLLGVILSYIVGVVLAFAFGYTDTVSLTTIGAGSVTFIVGPVTGAALNASSPVIAISIAAGVVKSIVVMIITPIMAKSIGLNNPQSAMVYGGLMGTTSGTAAGLAAVDPKLVPYGAMTATFYTGLGCLLCPSVLFLATKAIFG